MPRLRNYESLCCNVMLFIKKHHATDVGKILGCFQCQINVRNFVACISFSPPRLCFPFGFVRGCKGQQPLPPGNRGKGCPPGLWRSPWAGDLGQSLGLTPHHHPGTHHRPREPVPAPSLVKHPASLLIPAPLTGVWPWLLCPGSFSYRLALPGLLCCWADPLGLHSLCTRSPVKRLCA